LNRVVNFLIARLATSQNNNNNNNNNNNILTRLALTPRFEQLEKGII
jgi:hypothetical protein